MQHTAVAQVSGNQSRCSGRAAAIKTCSYHAPQAEEEAQSQRLLPLLQLVLDGA
jgi:hypothetical protein